MIAHLVAGLLLTGSFLLMLVCLVGIATSGKAPR